MGRFRKRKVEVEGKRATAFADALRETLEKGEYKRHDELLDRLLEQNYSPTDIASALIHLLGEDKSRGAEPIPADRRSHPPAHDHEALPRRSPSRAEDDFEPPMRNRRPRAEHSRPREEAGTVSHEAGMVRLAFNVGRAHAVLPGDFVGVIA